MRFDGTLTKWDDDRGFGFITPRQGDRQVFVHISAFPRNEQRPRLHESLSFEIESNNEGKKRAVNVRRTARSPQPRARGKVAKPPPPARSLLSASLTAVILCGIGVLGYTAYSNRWAMQAPGNAAEQSQASWTEQNQGRTAYRCDGRSHCSQMTSCAEAKFFLANCPGVQMDGDRDGVPCEWQWCTSFFAK
ncbi:MAG: cold shock domain-containing protein [Pseudomonadota bacterium]|nr:cold shock domain-containing protein [Pseudomonadota bacterium]